MSEEERIDVVSPNGEVGNIPKSQVQDWVNQGPDFRVFEKAQLQPVDLVDNGKRINVVSKVDNTPGTIDAAMVNDPEFNKNFTLASVAAKKAEYNKLVEANAKTIEEESSLTGALKQAVSAPKNVSADLFQDGKFKLQLEGADGSVQKFLVPPDKLKDYISQGAEFQDRNYQSLIDAYRKHIVPEEGKPSEVQRGVTTGGRVFNGLDYDIPDKLTNKLIQDPEANNDVRAREIARIVAEKTDPQLKVSAQAGDIASIPLSLLTGGGVAGEFALAKEAGAGVKAALGGGRLAKFAGGLAEGAAIVSPHALATAAIDKNPVGAVEELALGAGLGGLITGAGLVAKGAGAAITEARLGRAAKEIGLADETIAKLGTPSQQEGLLKVLSEKGVAEKGAAGRTEEVLSNLAKGEALEKVAPKLTSSAEKLANSTLTSKVEQIAEELTNKNLTRTTQQEGLTRFSEELTPYVDKTIKKIEKFSDKEGNISLENLVKLGKELGSEKLEGVLGTANKELHEQVINAALKVGDEATSKVDAKLTAEWDQSKYNLQVASELIKPEIQQKILTSAGEAGAKESKGIVSTLIEKALGVLEHKASHYVAGAAAHAIGLPGPVGLLMSQGVSKLASKAKNALLESYSSNAANPSKLTGWLGKQASNEHLASYLALDAIHAFTKKLSSIEPMLSGAAVKGATHDTAIKDILGTSANGLSKAQQFDKLADHLATASSQPDLAMANTKALSEPLRASHSAIADQFEAHMMNKIQYLYEIMPKDPSGKQPFALKDKWEPSAAELDTFQRQLKIAQDPFYVLSLVKDNTISNQDVATLSVLNPEILRLMRSEITKIAYSGKVDLPYQQKLSLSVLMGENMVTALNNIPLNQSIYGPVENSSAPVPQGTQAAKQSGRGGHKVNPEKVSQMTPSQRIMGK